MKKLLLMVVAVSLSTSAFAISKKEAEEINRNSCNAGWNDSYYEHFKQWHSEIGARVANGMAAQKIVSSTVDKGRTVDWLRGYEITRVCVRGSKRGVNTIDIRAKGILSVPSQFSKSRKKEHHAWEVHWRNDLRQQTFSRMKFESMDISIPMSMNLTK